MLLWSGMSKRSILFGNIINSLHVCSCFRNVRLFVSFKQFDSFISSFIAVNNILALHQIGGTQQQWWWENSIHFIVHALE